MRYLPIIQLDVAHSYYQNGYCPAFHIEPDRKTKKILRDHRCIFKSRPGGFLVAQTVNDNDVPVIELAVSTKFRFMMWPADANCLLFTDMSNFYSHRTALFTNKGVDDNKLKLTSDISQERRVFAGIEIEITDALKSDKKIPVRYQVDLSAKQAYWEYFVILGKELGELSAYEIVHAEYQEEAHLKDSLPAIRFQRETLAAQPITDWINREYPDADILYFVSEEPVLCQQVPRKNIQLLFNKELLLNNLPNPSVHRISQRTEGLGDSVTVKDTLFHLVKHLNHSL